MVCSPLDIFSLDVLGAFRVREKLVNLLSPIIYMHILLTVLQIFLMLLVGRIWLNINTFHVW